jgi:hypothetical protein
MIALLAASAVYLTGLQATIDTPRQAFWACVKVQKSKAVDQKVGGDGFEAYLRNASSNEIQSLQSAIAVVDMKNGMTRKAATQDAASSINDYVSDPVDTYKTDFAAAAPKLAAAPTQSAAVTKAAQPSSQQPKL